MLDQINPRLNVARVARASAITMAAFFVLCWLGALLPIGPASHMHLGPFTADPGVTFVALFQRVCWSIAFGLIVGCLNASRYNGLPWLERKHSDQRLTLT